MGPPRMTQRCAEELSFARRGVLRGKNHFRRMPWYSCSRRLSFQLRGDCKLWCRNEGGGSRMLKRRASFILLGVVGPLVIGYSVLVYSARGNAKPAEPRLQSVGENATIKGQSHALPAKITNLDKLDPLKAIFQGDRGKVRLISLLSPT